MATMHLKSVNYFERLGQTNEWSLNGLELGPVNLIVGKNASGKTRTTNLLWSLARMFADQARFNPHEAGYHAVFDNNGEQFEYKLDVRSGTVYREEVIVNGNTLLIRGVEGGEIFFEKLGTRMEFRPPANELAAVARQDTLQHPFLEPLHTWAHAVRHYFFGASLGKDRLAMVVIGGPEVNDRDPNQAVGIFRKAEKTFGESFVKAVIDDMREMHYEIESVGAHVPEHIRIEPAGLQGELQVIGVIERGVNGVVDQTQMSQGMFRALSILIQVNYSQMANRANCILIDDIGEGLDFDRSTRLIQILRRKAKSSAFQLIMTTNDQFVMNHVPLEEWSILERNGSNVVVRNHINSAKQFEEFKFVGMSNFTFFEMDYVNEAAAQEESVSHE